jgi:ribonuclease Z
MEVTILGTGCMMPTKERALFAAFVSMENEGILVDCSEGTQRQMRIAGINLMKITKILITHWHGDHMLGLPGLIQSMGGLNYSKKLTIYGPKGTKKFFENMKKSYYFDIRIEIEIKEIRKGTKKKGKDEDVIFENKDYKITAKEMEHAVPCIGDRIQEQDKRRIDMRKARKIGLTEGPLLGRLQDGETIDFKGNKIKPEDVADNEKGKSIGFVMDTVMCSNAIEIAKDADLLIAEATFVSELEEKGEEYGHMTAKQAATLANLANAKRLVLAHFSQGYKTTEEILEDAKKVYDNVQCAHDLMKIKV